MVTQHIAVPDVTEILFARKFAYDILRRLFIEEPDREYLKHMINQMMIEQFPFAKDCETIHKGVEDVKEYLTQFDVVNKRSDFEDLHWDYTRMLVGPFELEAPPWESVYVQKDKLLFNKCTMSVRKDYERYGFKVGKMNLEADDHIGLELDFMYHLNEFCLRVIEENSNNVLGELEMLIRGQDEFLNNHLLKFAPIFCQNVIDHAETQFYQGMAQILNGYLKMDSKVLKELLVIDITL